LPFSGRENDVFVFGAISLPEKRGKKKKPQFLYRRNCFENENRVFSDREMLSGEKAVSPPAEKVSLICFWYVPCDTYAFLLIDRVLMMIKSISVFPYF
jgi:hypothetical protein